MRDIVAERVCPVPNVRVRCPECACIPGVLAWTTIVSSNRYVTTCSSSYCDGLAERGALS